MNDTPIIGRPRAQAPPAAGGYTRLTKSLLYGSIVALAIYVVFEAIEHFWLSGLEQGGLHLVRDLLSSLIVAGFVGWMMLKASPDLLASPLRVDRGVEFTQLTAAERTEVYARWFIAMRWIAVVLAGILVAASIHVAHWLSEAVLWPLGGTVAALALLNVVYGYLLPHERALPTLLAVQGYLDLVGLTVLLHFSGGIENPLSMMMIFHVIIAGILLSRHQCYWIAATGSVLFALLAMGEWSDALDHYKLELFPAHIKGQAAHHTPYVASWIALQTVVLFLSAYFVTTLAERLRENERRLEALAGRAMAGQQMLEQALETTGTGLRVLDAHLQDFWANKRWREWFDSRPAGAPGAAPAVLAAVGAPAGQTLADGQVRVTEFADPHPRSVNGSTRADPCRVFQITTAPLRDMGGAIHQVVELAQDITEQKETQAQMMRAGRLAAAGELAGRVAHEVNNPIAIITAKARLLSTDHREEMSAKVAQEVGKIIDLSNRVARIAQGLLSYCRPSPATRTRLDVRHPVRKSLAMVEQHARKLGVAICDELPESVPAVEANAQELEQVFMNLFLNAFDAMPRGGRLSVRSAPAALPSETPAVAITVEDTGTGIPLEIRERIFEPFFTTKQDGRGTGLGLSICVGLVRSHGGDITVESNPGHGSRFTIRLPIETTEEARHA